VDISQGSPVNPPGPDAGGRGAALDRVKLPAIFLIVAAGLSALGALVGMISPGMNEERLAQVMDDPTVPDWVKQAAEATSGSAAFLPYLATLVISAIVLFGALKMMRLQSFGWAMAAAILAVIPCLSPCCCLGIPFGIWALVVLSKPEVKAAFV
jgi:hypothetical protein